MPLKSPIPIEAVLNLEVLNLTDEETTEAKVLIASNPTINKYIKYLYAEELRNLANMPALHPDVQVVYAQHQTALTIYTNLLTGETD